MVVDKLLALVLFFGGLVAAVLLIKKAKKKDSISCFYWTIVSDMGLFFWFFHEWMTQEQKASYIVNPSLGLIAGLIVVFILYLSFAASLHIIDQRQRFRGIMFIVIKLLVVDTVLTFFLVKTDMVIEANPLTAGALSNEILYFALKLLPTIILGAYLLLDKREDQLSTYYATAAIYLIYGYATVSNLLFHVGFLPALLMSIPVVIVFAGLINLIRHKTSLRTEKGYVG